MVQAVYPCAQRGSAFGVVKPVKRLHCVSKDRHCVSKEEHCVSKDEPRVVIFSNISSDNHAGFDYIWVLSSLLAFKRSDREIR
jgi:hypothetical protein